MIYTTKRFSLKGAALYGGGYIVGGLAGEAVGKKIGEHFKRELGPKDLKKTEAELKELRKFLEVHKNQQNLLLFHNFLLLFCIIFPYLHFYIYHFLI